MLGMFSFDRLRKHCFLLTMFFPSVYMDTATKCTTAGWFGEDCKYQCHCKDDKSPCDPTLGLCSKGCHQDWFGPACQYKAVKYSPDAEGKSLAWLSDGDPSTCNDGNAESVSVRLDTAYLFTWVRFVVSKSGDHKNIVLKYQLSTAKNASAELSHCMGAYTAVVNNVTLDISCPTIIPVSRVKLSGSGVQSLCSFFISGGRNVALKQKSELSDRNMVDSPKVVDGVLGDAATSAQTCTVVEDEDTGKGWWLVTLSRDIHPYSVILYNWRESPAEGCCVQALQKYKLQLFGGDGTLQHTYKDPQSEPVDVYTMVPVPWISSPVKLVKVTNDPSQDYLRLCEAQVFGEGICPSGTYGRDCEHRCNCEKDKPCFTSTGGCPGGCRMGYGGENCSLVCEPGFYGSGCSERCGHCSRADVVCDRVNGSCGPGGCTAGYLGFACNVACPLGTFGQDCSELCKSNCTGANDTCDNVGGTCDGRCAPGKRGMFCEEKCLKGTFGFRCKACSDQCAASETPCDYVSGECLQGCKPGYVAPTCFDECPHSFYGQGCELKCNSSCLNYTCHPVTGKCLECVAGLGGDFCSDDEVLEPPPDEDKVKPYIAIVAACVLVSALVLTALLCYRRRKGQAAAGEGAARAAERYSGSHMSAEYYRYWGEGEGAGDYGDTDRWRNWEDHGGTDYSAEQTGEYEEQYNY